MLTSPKKDVPDRFVRQPSLVHQHGDIHTLPCPLDNLIIFTTWSVAVNAPAFFFAGGFLVIFALALVFRFPAP